MRRLCFVAFAVLSACGDEEGLKLSQVPGSAVIQARPDYGIASLELVRGNGGLVLLWPQSAGHPAPSQLFSQSVTADLQVRDDRNEPALYHPRAYHSVSGCFREAELTVGWTDEIDFHSPPGDIV
jgi:hypothetical protein